MGEEKYFIYVGNAVGNTTIEDGERKGEKRPYVNMYVLSPVSTYTSDDYKAFGFKAEKMKCISPDVWKDLTLGELCQLYFDDKKRVALASSLGSQISLEP